MIQEKNSKNVYKAAAAQKKIKILAEQELKHFFLSNEKTFKGTEQKNRGGRNQVLRTKQEVADSDHVSVTEVFIKSGTKFPGMLECPLTSLSSDNKETGRRKCQGVGGRNRY